MGKKRVGEKAFEGKKWKKNASYQKEKNASYQKCTLCAYWSSLLLTCEILCVYQTHFEPFRAYSKHEQIISLQRPMPWLMFDSFNRSKVIQLECWIDSCCFTARRKVWIVQDIGWSGWFTTLVNLAAGRGSWEVDLSVLVAADTSADLLPWRTPSGSSQRSSCAAVPWKVDRHFLHDYHRDWFPRLGTNSCLPSTSLLQGLQRSQETSQERPVICVHTRLEIGHKDYSERQFVYRRQFKEFHNDLRVDYVFFVPPSPF